MRCNEPPLKIGPDICSTLHSMWPSPFALLAILSAIQLGEIR